jgi:hypothetical protein
VTLQPIPDEVRRFVLFAIPSVPFLEALLLMRSTPRQTWTAAQIASSLYVGEGKAADLLAELSAAAIVERKLSGFRYCPRDEQMAELLDSLAAAYSRHLVEISQMIHAKTNGKPHHFANAFILRNKP